MKIVKEKFVDNVTAMEILKKEKELKFFQKQTLEHLKKFYGGMKTENVEKLKNELSSLDFLSERNVVEIINVMPKDKSDIFLVLSKQIKGLKEEHINKVFEIVKKYL